MGQLESTCTAPHPGWDLERLEREPITRGQIHSSRGVHDVRVVAVQVAFQGTF
jgi:hypothetical protein